MRKGKSRRTVQLDRLVSDDDLLEIYKEELTNSNNVFEQIKENPVIFGEHIIDKNCLKISKNLNNAKYLSRRMMKLVNKMGLEEKPIIEREDFVEEIKAISAIKEPENTIVKTAQVNDSKPDFVFSENDEKL